MQLLLLGELLPMLGDEHPLLLLGVPLQRHARHPRVDQLDAWVSAHRDHSLLVVVVMLESLLQHLLLLELLLKLKLLLVLQLLFALASVKIVHVDSDVDELESCAVAVEID